LPDTDADENEGTHHQSDDSLESLMSRRQHLPTNDRNINIDHSQQQQPALHTACYTVWYGILEFNVPLDTV